MPQMAPLNWLTLMLFFLSIFLIFNVLNYWVYSYKTISSSSLKKNISINWKW